jgi:hypothetical protein
VNVRDPGYQVFLNSVTSSGLSCTGHNTFSDPGGFCQRASSNNIAIANGGIQNNGNYTNVGPNSGWGGCGA